MSHICLDWNPGGLVLLTRQDGYSKHTGAALWTVVEDSKGGLLIQREAGYRRAGETAPCLRAYIHQC